MTTVLTKKWLAARNTAVALVTLPLLFGYMAVYLSLAVIIRATTGDDITQRRKGVNT